MKTASNFSLTKNTKHICSDRCVVEVCWSYKSSFTEIDMEDVKITEGGGVFFTVQVLGNILQHQVKAGGTRNVMKKCF
jgi:hypothetical protein